jgi:ABC-2 type transport system permease protein
VTEVKKVFILLKANIKSFYNSLSRSKAGRPIFLFGLLSVAGVVFYFIQKFARLIISVGAVLNLPIDIGSLLLNIILIIGFVYVIMISFSIILSVLYFSSDTALLMSLPLRERDVFAGRFIFTVLEESLWLLVLMYPFFVGYGIMHSAGILFYIETFIFVVLYPIIPFSIAVFIILPLARRFNPRKLQTTFVIINIFIAVGIYGFYMLSNSGFLNIQGLNDLFRSGSSILQFLPTNLGVLFAKLLTENNILFGSFIFLIFVLISAGIFYLGVFVSMHAYREGLGKFEMIETKKYKSEAVKGETRVLSFLPRKIQAIVFKDLKMLRREPKLFVSLMPVFAIMVIFFLVFVVALRTKYIAGSVQALFTPVFFFALASSQIGTITLQIFYPEGSNVWILFSSKVSGRDFVLGKFVFPFLVSVVLNSVFFLVALFVGQLPLFHILVVAAFAFFIPFLLSSVGVFISSMFPVFRTAENPRKMIPGRTTLINLIILYSTIGLSFLVVYVESLISKVMGNGAAGLITFGFVGVFCIGIGLSLLAISSKRLKYVDIR